MARREPKRAPRWPQEGPRRPQDSPKRAQDEANMAQHGASDPKLQPKGHNIKNLQKFVENEPGATPIRWFFLLLKNNLKLMRDPGQGKLKERSTESCTTPQKDN